jgi:hypothetical protein
MHVSCLGLARLRGTNQRYALAVDTHRLQRTGERVLKPLGGHLRATPTALSYLRVMGATPSEDDFGPLRFTIASKELPTVEAWLRRTGNRETSIMQSLRKNLVDEMQVLHHGNLSEVRERHDTYCTLDLPSEADTDPTRLVIEVFDVSVSPRTLATLQRAASVPVAARRVHFVTADEIKNGVTRDGVRIDPISETIL